MPLIRSASRSAISANIRAERAAGKPERQAVAIAMSEADRARKGHTMDGIRQHKAMAMGQAIPQGGSKGTGMPPYANPLPSPDRKLDTGNTLSAGNRAIGKLIGGNGSKMGATPHPDHGPHHHRHAGTGRSAY